jgi:CspA family cold shock protein
MPNGRVKWWNDNQGFGFITQSNGQDVFVHHTAIQTDGYPTLAEGQFVEFEITQERNGLRAHNVREPGESIQPSHVWVNTAPTQIKIFNEPSTRRAEYEINAWVEETGCRIINASMTNNAEEGYVSVIVVFSTS